MSGPSTLHDPQAGGTGAPATPEAPAPVETRRSRVRRNARRGRLYLSAMIAVALLVCVVALAVSNTGRVRLHWILGSGSASLVWIVVLAALLGWLLGKVTGSSFRWRTRAPPGAAAGRARRPPATDRGARGGRIRPDGAARSRPLDGRRRPAWSFPPHRGLSLPQELSDMQYVIYEDNGGICHWRLTDTDGTALAVSATTFITADEARAARRRTCTSTRPRRLHRGEPL
jgi:uncharacterized integral membrane protein